MQEQPEFTAQNGIMDRKIVPAPTFAENPALVELYYAAWQSAYTHIFTCPGAPVETYMNEGIRSNHIWIWDTCFMVQFCRYAADRFPGIQSLDNFYRVIHDGEYMVLKVHHPDNPPLFAWTEYEYLKHTGDLARIRRILLEKQYLQKHFDFVNSLRAGSRFPYAFMPIKAQYHPGAGYCWDGNSSGMDNTPRGRGDYESIYWLDLAAQQGLSALYIARLAEAVGESALADVWRERYSELKTLVNTRFWSPEDRMYFDRRRDGSGFCKVLTPASVWPLMAEMCDAEQLSALTEVLSDPTKLGCGPVASVSADDSDFDPRGAYWRGGVWLPTVYMCVKALEKSGRQELADAIADAMIDKILRTYRNQEPHTFWECYSPVADLPATNKGDKPHTIYSRPDFCGWTALGPISLFIENRLGVREVDALTRTIRWEPRSRRSSGIRDLRLGGDRVALSAEPEQHLAVVECTAPFTLVLNGRSRELPAGISRLPLD